MFVFRKIWRALFACNTRFEIRLLPYCRRNNDFVRIKNFCNYYLQVTLNALRNNLSRGNVPLRNPVYLTSIYITM